MNLPISFKIPRLPNRLSQLQAWVDANGLPSNRLTYDPYRSIVTFMDERDAVAYSLAFNCLRHSSKVDQLLQLDSETVRGSQ